MHTLFKLNLQNLSTVGRSAKLKNSGSQCRIIINKLKVLMCLCSVNCKILYVQKFNLFDSVHRK